MKLRAYFALVFLLLPTVSPGENRSKDWHDASIGNWVEINKAQNGFLRFRGAVGDCQVIALSRDIGSAGPEEDLALYLSSSAGIHLALSLPTMIHRLYWVREDHGNLVITLSQGSFGAKIMSQETEPLLVIDLGKFVKNYP